MDSEDRREGGVRCVCRPGDPNPCAEKCPPKFELVERCIMQFKDGRQCVLNRGHSGIHQHTLLPYQERERSDMLEEFVERFENFPVKPNMVPVNSGTLPSDASERNNYPMADGLLYYFPAALAEVARVSKLGNDQHNPGEPMHWARGKSTDHENKIMRHLVDAGMKDTDGTRHTAKLAWRALALLQEECERDGAPRARNAR